MNILKTDLSSIVILAALTFGSLHSANAEPILLGGFHGENETAQQSPDATDKVTVTLTRTGPSSDITQGFSQMFSTTWGTSALDVAPLDSNSPSGHAIVQTGVVDAEDNPLPFTLVLQVNNNGTFDLFLDKIHFLTKKDIANVGPNSGSITYTAGDLSDSTGASIGFSIPNGSNIPFDIALSDFLTDTTLAKGESATFTWAHGPAQDPTGNTAIRLDNFAISGEFSAATRGSVIYVR